MDSTCKKYNLDYKFRSRFLTPYHISPLFLCLPEMLEPQLLNEIHSLRINSQK